MEKVLNTAFQMIIRKTQKMMGHIIVMPKWKIFMKHLKFFKLNKNHLIQLIVLKIILMNRHIHPELKINWYILKLLYIICSMHVKVYKPFMNI